METFLQDLRYSVRSLTRNPGFTVVVLATIAIGVGANTAIFSVIRGVLLKPLPFDEPGRVVITWSENQDRRIEDDLITLLDMEAWQQESELFTGFAASVYWGLALRTGERSIDVETMLVSPNLFDVLGARPFLGRTFVPGEDAPGRHRVAVISQGFWQRQFGGDSAVVGSTIILDGQPYSLVGVMPSGFMFPDEEREMWVPLAWDVLGLAKTTRMYPVVGRMRAGVSVEQAQEELSRISAGLADAYPRSHEGWTIRAETVLDLVVAGSRRMLVLLQTAVALMLLIVCANVASLVLARTVSRQRDIAVRSALGAGRGRLMRQLLTESLLIALVGGGLGVALAVVSLNPILALAPEALPRADQIQINQPVLAFGVGLSLLTGLLFGIAPAYRLSVPNPADSMRDAGASSAGGFRGRNLRHSIVVLDHALAVMLLVGAGLLLRTFVELSIVDTGFAKQNVLSATIYLQGDKYETSEQHIAYYEQVMDRIKQVQGVVAVGATNALPMHPTAQTFSHEFSIPGRPETETEATRAGFRIVTPDYFSAIGVPLVAGRDAALRDRADTPDVVLINQALANRYWPGENPVGQHVIFSFRGRREAEVIGVVGDVRHDGLRDTPIPEIYAVFAQIPICGCLTVVASTESDPRAFVEPMHAAILQLDRTQPADRVDTIDQMLNRQLGLERFVLTLVGAFSVVALFLASIGIYGVMAYTVNQSRKEIGIRTALGAGRGAVLKLVFERGLVLTGLGTVLGIGGALVLARTVSTVIYGVSPRDAMTYVVIAVVSVTAGLLATYLPAQRAASVDPVTALRE